MACEITYPTEDIPPSSGEEGGDGDDSDSGGDQSDGQQDSEFDGDEPSGEQDSDSDRNEEEEQPSNDSEHSLGGRNSRKGKRKEAETGNPGRGDASGSRRSLPRAAKRPAGLSSAGQQNRGKRRRLSEDDSDSSADSEPEIHRPRRRAGRGKRVGKGNGASGSRRPQIRPSTAMRLAQTGSGMDTDLRKQLLASNIVTTTKFSLEIGKLSLASKRAVKKAIDCSNPETPSVLLVMRKFHISPGIMYLPTEFSDEHFHRNSEWVMLRAYEENGECVGEYMMLAKRNNCNTVIFRKEWGIFRNKMQLVKGDVCLLNLIDVTEEQKVFNVHIFRA